VCCAQAQVASGGRCCRSGFLSSVLEAAQWVLGLHLLGTQRSGLAGESDKTVHIRQTQSGQCWHGARSPRYETTSAVD
jgi:hypothetical protein